MTLRNRRSYRELKEEAEDRKRWKRQFISIERKEEIHIFHKSIDLLISSILNNNISYKKSTEVFDFGLYKARYVNLNRCSGCAYSQLPHITVII